MKKDTTWDDVKLTDTGKSFDFGQPIIEPPHGPIEVPQEERERGE
jgi:hypothetical protein